MNIAPTIIIDQDLLIRQPKPSDIKERFKLGKSLEFRKMVGGSTINLPPYKQENAENLYNREIKKKYSWFIEYKGEMIGVCRIKQVNDSLGRFSIGIYNDKLFSKGIGTKVTKKVIEFAFVELGLFVIELMVLEYNKRAINCYKNSGFMQTKILENNLEIEGVYYNDVIMRIHNIDKLSKIPLIDLGDIYLRAVQYEDYVDMYDYGKLDDVTKYLVWNTYKDISEAKASVENIFLNRPHQGTPSAYAIVSKENNKMIGTCDIFRVDWQNLIGEIGYVLHKDYWGKGYMTKTCKKLIDFGFNYLHLNKLDIGHEINNTGSRRVIEKCGFKLVKEEYNEKIKMYGRFYEMKRINQ